MAKRKATRLTADEAVTAINTLLRKKRGTWDRTDWQKRNELMHSLPPGVPEKTVAKLLAIFDVNELDKVPAQHDAALARELERRYERKDEDAAFVVAALAAGNNRLRDVLAIRETLSWPGRVDRVVLARLVKRADLVEAARAAFAVGGMHVTSVYLPILVADASRDSLDLLVPHVARMVKRKDSDLDWFRKNVVPLFGDTPHAQGIIAMLTEATDARTSKSPARAFVMKLGVTEPPPVVQLSLTFRDARERTVWQIRVDSRQASWMQARRNEKWMWRGATEVSAKELPDDRASYVLRVGKGLDRAPIDAWAKSLLP